MAFEIENILSKNLIFEENRIRDPKTGNDYGIVDNDDLILSDGDVFRIHLTDITSIKKGQMIHEIRIEKKNGTIIKGYWKPHIETRIHEENPYFDGSIYSYQKYIPQILPELEHYVFYDILSNQLIVDEFIINSDEVRTKHKFVPLSDALICALALKIEKESLKFFKSKFKTSREMLFNYFLSIEFRKKHELPRYNSFLIEIQNLSFEDIGPFRCEDFLINAGASLPDGFNEFETEKYLKAVSTAIFLGIIEKQIEDYSTVDFVPIFIGKTGSGKSTLCKKLGFGYNYGDNVLLSNFYREVSVQPSKIEKLYEATKGGVIVELREALQFKKDPDELKNMIDLDAFTLRLPYKHHPETIQARYLSIATTNNYEILTDLTGNRRFYPIYFEDSLTDVLEITHNDIIRYYADALNKYQSGLRFRDLLSEVQDVAEKLRSMSLVEPNGLNEMDEFLDRWCNPIGSVITSPLIKQVMKTEYGIYKIDELGKIMQLCGFEPSLNTVRIPKSSDLYQWVERYGLSDRSRGFIRKRPSSISQQGE